MSDEQSKTKKGFSRRKFIVRSAVGAGVLLGAGILVRPYYRRSIAQLANTLEASYMGSGVKPPLWFEITADNQVILHSPKVEMGQGVLTGLAQIAADELEVDFENIRVVHAESKSGNVDLFSTGGSTSINSLWIPLRELAATMREMLKNQAAQQWQIDPESCTAKNGVVVGGGQSMTYGAIVEKATEWKIPKTPALKDPKTYQFVGKPLPRVDLYDKVVGAPIFGMDAQMDGMLYGSVLRPHLIGATFVDADTSAAEKMPGVIQIVREKDFVGVVAASYTEAENAKNAIKAEWKTDRNWQTEDIEALIEVGKGNPVVIQKKGAAKRILDNEEEVITAEFQSPIGAHAQMEPNGTLAHVTDDGATIIISTQVVEITRKEVAKALGFKKEQVNVVPTFLGGAFGRRLHTPNAVQAALLSKAVGKPVKCFFNRKEEFQQDTFRPPTHHLLRGKLNEEGGIKAIEHHISSGDVLYGSPLLPSFAQTIVGSDIGAWRGGMFQYRAIPNHRAISWRVKLPFATSWWRSLGLLANTFAIESFLDELAVKAGQNPVDFRLAHIQDDKAGFRLREVIKKAATAAGYKDEVVDGRAMGFAASTDANTPCAQVAEVSIEEGMIKVHKVTCALDPGLVINPDQVRAQCEGSIIMGLSAALYEHMLVVDGQLQPTIYGPYRMALMRDAPKEIDIHLLENDEAPGGVGEPPLGPIGAAVANALFRLTGKRIRSMPIALNL